MKTPKIRFKGYTEAWEQRKVTEVAERFDNLRIPVAANLRVPGDTPYYGANGIQDYVEGYTHDGEFVLVAEDGANDLVNYPVNYVNGRVWVNNHAHVIQGMKDICDNRFLSYAMSRADIASVLVGGGRAKLNADIMMNIQLDVPSVREQLQIGAYFKQLDHLITLHQWKLIENRKMRQSVWEQRKLGEIFNFQYGEFNNNPDNGGEYPIYGANGVIGGYTKYNAESSSIIGHMGAYAGYVVWAEGKHFVTYNGTIAKPSDDFLDSKFGHYLLCNKQIYKICAGSGQPFVSYADLNGIDVVVPKEKVEQEQVAGYFTQLDNLITLHQWK